jgi:hypothetical protein
MTQVADPVKDAADIPEVSVMAPPPFGRDIEGAFT